MNLRTLTIALLGAVTLGTHAYTAQNQGAPRSPDWENSGEIHDLLVQGNVHLFVGAGANVAVEMGEEGVLIVDTGRVEHAAKLLTAIKQLSSEPIRYIINTHFHPDHTGGNDLIGKAGRTTQGAPTTIISHENALTRMTAAGGVSFDALPNDTYVPEEKDIFFNEPVLMYHDPAGHTDGDTIVFFRRSDVIVAGDIFVTTGYPRIASQDGGGIDGVLSGLNRILDLAVPKHEQEGGTYVIPGHGRVCDEADVVFYRDMVTIIRDRIADMAKRGLTLAQVQTARPTLDYDLHYGSDAGPWTTAMFVEAIYNNVSKPSAGRRPAR